MMSDPSRCAAAPAGAATAGGAFTAVEDLVNKPMYYLSALRPRLRGIPRPTADPRQRGGQSRQARAHLGFGRAKDHRLAVVDRRDRVLEVVGDRPADLQPQRPLDL